MRALVTGAAGFIGSHLAQRLLSLGWDVTALDAFTDYYPRWVKQRNIATWLPDPRCHFVEADLTTCGLAPLLRGVDYVFHLAARAGVRSSWGDSFDAYLNDNLLATQRLLEATRDAGVRKLVYASSSSIYGDAETYPTAESTPPLPISPYGVTKLGGEHLCQVYQRRFGVPAVSLRFFTVYGPRQRPDMAFHIFIRAILGGQPLRVFGDGSQSREFTHVDDIVDALCLAAERGHEGGVYNIGGGSEVVLRDAISMLMGLCGREVPLEFGDRMPGDARRTAADISLARHELGYEPRVGLEQGLASEIEWLRGLLAEECAREARDKAKTAAAAQP